jgi:hypothetical protein|tara:strand:+ start:1523 stop:1735 length:213 start_codon:yes stop_codon:yes gene_type:complete
MKEWMVVKFTGVGNSAKAGDVTIWSDYTNSGMVYDSPAYEIVYRTSDFKEAQAIARHQRLHKYPRLTHQA